MAHILYMIEGEEVVERTVVAMRESRECFIMPKRLTVESQSGMGSKTTKERGSRNRCRHPPSQTSAQSRELLFLRIVASAKSLSLGRVSNERKGTNPFFRRLGTRIRAEFGVSENFLLGDRCAVRVDHALHP